MGLAVMGELSRPSGLGESARLILAGLRALGVATHEIDVGDAVGGRSAPMTLPPPGMPLLIHVNAPTLPLALLRAPRALLRGRRVIGYWAWELPTMPPDWRAGLDFVHEIWVLSRFTADAVRSLLPPGSPIAVKVVTPPVALHPPVASGRDRALVSFSLASSFARKNPVAAIAAHRQAFGDRPDRVLLIKAGHAAAHAADFQVMQAAAQGLPNVMFETRMFDDADRHALTACADIVMSLHRSEGLGLVPAEAMLLGRPVIATGWSATTEFMDTSCARPVGYRLIPAVDPRAVFEAPGAMWAEADIGAAAAALVELADDPALRTRLGAAAREMATQRLGLGPLAEAVAAL